MPVPRACTFVIPGDWHTPTGGYRYDRRIVLALREAGWRVELCTLGDGFPWPDAATRTDAERRLAALADGTLVVADGLAFGALPDPAQRHAARLRWVALVHHPLHIETDLAEAERSALRDQEQRALQAARRVITTSAATASAVAALGVAAERIAVVEPGTDPATRPAAVRSSRAGELRLLCVATLTPRKGHAVLLAALAGLQDLPWTLHNIGSASRDPATAARLQATSVALGLAGRVHWHGEVDEETLAGHYAAADLFVLPSFHEGYGMAVAEALAHGLPVVTTTGGALAQTLPPAAGLAVAPGDVAALRAALARLLVEPSARAACAAAAREVSAGLPTWTQAALRFAAVLEGVR
jgi:glycosyltransferase involved in cell wall biosynthesis